ncbi:MAG: hypothetical protein ABEI96_08515 [Haloarculaceae archaeon]
MSDDEDWRFELSDLPTLEDEDENEEAAGRDAGGDGGNVAGAFAPTNAVEPGSPDLENVAFVLLGVVLTIVVFVAPVLGLGDPATLGALVVAVAAAVAAVVLYRSLRPDGD